MDGQDFRGRFGVIRIMANLYKKLEKLIEQDYFEFAMNIIDDVKMEFEKSGLDAENVVDLEEYITMLYYERLRDEKLDKVIMDLDVILDSRERIDIIEGLI